ncbi:MAG: RIP metalloprotease RseP [Alphaproteobacteria bacterium]|nr:RIP metalloprotease RseP [Alphaproteobacteria bacterium]
MEKLIDLLFQWNVLHAWYYAASFFIIISIIVFIHELGHYTVAKLFGVKVEAFSIGFGKELVGWNDRSGTRWKISLLPLGGYVRMFGDANPASFPELGINELPESQRKQAFFFKPLWIKAAVVFAGPFANFLLTFCILSGFFYVYGQRIVLPIADEIMPNTPAFAAGIKAGDKVLKVDGENVNSFADLQRIISLHPGITVTLVIERSGKPITLAVTPKDYTTKDIFGNETRIGLLGIASKTEAETHPLSLPNAMGEAVKETYDMSASTLLAMKQMVVGQRSVKELGGPIKIAKYSGQSVHRGWKTAIWFVAVLSLNLGLINLFPIPVLDGGHIFIYAIQGIIRRPIPPKILEYGMRVGLALISALMIFVILNDIMGYF